MSETVATVRRMGVEGSETRLLLVEAAAQLLQEGGSAAVSARQVAAKAGLKTQLIYYYFRTMDDLILAVVRKINESRIKRFEQIMASPEPLRALWELNNDPAGATLSAELISLASRRETVRVELAKSATEFREMQIAAVARLLAARGVDPETYPAAGLVMLMSGISRAIVTESALGVSAGHLEALALVERTLRRLEDGPKPHVRNRQ